MCNRNGSSCMHGLLLSAKKHLFALIDAFRSGSNLSHQSYGTFSSPWHCACCRVLEYRYKSRITLSLITTATAVLLPFFSSTRVNQYDDTDHTDPRSDKQFSSCLEVTERCLLIQCYRFAVVNVGKCYGTFHLLYQQRKCDSVFTVAFY